MLVFKKAAALQQYISTLKLNRQSIGFVPTMGALHQGHLSLIAACRQQCAITVCSIFVNPTQFNDPKDFEKYPVTIENDILLLTQHGATILFLPGMDEVYPEGTTALPHYALGEIETILEGRYRPGHFQGVCQVVDKLIGIVEPHTIFFGQKDYQQCMVIKKLIALKNLAVEMYIHPTVREQDGLAMSSRNTRLSPEGRKKAVALYATLNFLHHHVFSQDIHSLEAIAIDKLLGNGFERVDYIALADAATLQPLTIANPSRPSVLLAAAFIDGVRLIDNLPVCA